ncbi:MAG: 2-succinyl-5-enolpyruvyl-6-hydroxy-3-cyclohexene-1-carboxylic-acid synthase [Microbacteriaceae bacterium]
MIESPASRWSSAFLGELVALGVTDFVISPGARSQSLALAALEWEKVSQGSIALHVVIDERSAGFRALGLGMESGRPAVCIATSGSAPTHFYPAIVEAQHAGVALIVISADRPAELQGVGANQTMDQSELFGTAAKTWNVVAPGGEDEADPSALARELVAGALAGLPVHLNVAFREPLSSLGDAPHQLPELHPPSADPREGIALTLEPAPGTIVIAGHGAGADAEDLAVSLGAPLIAEVVSGARFGPHLVLSYRQVLDLRALPTDITRVIAVGRPTLSRQVWSLLSDPTREHIVLSRRESEPANPSRTAHVVGSIVVSRAPTAEEKTQWVKPWVMAGRIAHQAALDALLPAPPDLALLESNDPATRSAFATQEMGVLRRAVTRGELSLALWEATWPHDRLVFGASRMVREADTIVGSKNITVFANRGLSGIDGTISTARGIAHHAATNGAAGITRVLLGDLALLHDAGSLLLEPGAHSPARVHLFVANDGGGTIFDGLEVSQSASAADRDRVLYTPHEVDLEALAKAYGWAYQRVSTMGELTDALGRAEPALFVDVGLER